MEFTFTVFVLFLTASNLLGAGALLGFMVWRWVDRRAAQGALAEASKLKEEFAVVSRAASDSSLSIGRKVQELNDRVNALTMKAK